ncbi:MarR family transcriptional regulator [Litoreibacter sp.]|nr:MarR family transcriptional regulator [Litoreibacter sp.]
MHHDTKLPSKAEDLICFALYSASHALNRAYHPMLKRLGLTYPQYIALTLLWTEDGQTVGALSKHMTLDTGTLTPLLKRLEALGHITRKKGDTDARQVVVTLTPSGNALRAKAPDITKCIIGATGLDLAKLTALVDTVSALRDNVLNADADP